MAELTISGQFRTSNAGAALLGLIDASDLTPGAAPSYQLAKDIYLFHPLGAKIASKPIELAQSEGRKFSVPGAGTASDKVVAAFVKKAKEIRVDRIVHNTGTLARVYGAAVPAILVEGKRNNAPLDIKNLYEKKIAFNVYDPLNVAGSLALNLDPLSMDFLHVANVSVTGDAFHRSCCRVLVNEDPIYLAWTSSTYSYTGRSVYQRSLLPLKSFVQTMITDDMISLKAGVIVAKIKQAGSIINQRMRNLFGFKRDVVKEAVVGNVISIGTEGEEIETLNFQNLSEPFKLARTNIIENIASATPMPAILLTEEALGASFHEGSEDAKNIARYVDSIRDWLDPIYEWIDPITMRLAWTPEFFVSLQAEYPEEFGDIKFEDFFWKCSNSFKVEWPSLLKEPDSELVKVDDLRLKAVIQWVETLMPEIPQDQKALVIQWANDKFNELRTVFPGDRLDLDYEAIAEYEKAEAEPEIGPQKNQFRADSVEPAIKLMRHADKRIA